MNAGLGIVLGMLVASSVAAFLCWLGGYRKTSRILWAIFGLVLASPLYYEYSFFPDSVVVSFDKDGRAIRHPNGMFCWEFGKAYTNMPLCQIAMNGGVTILTENPKVRKIRYELKMWIVDPDKFYRIEERRGPNWLRGESPTASKSYDMHDRFDQKYPTANDEVAKLVAFQLYKFNSANSKLLATFDNPLDYSQQGHLKVVLDSDLNPELEKEGIKTSFQRFFIE